LTGNIVAIVFYVFGGIFLVVVFSRYKNTRLPWKRACIFGAVLSFLISADKFNQMPMLWMNYDTLVSKQMFLINQTISILLQFFLDYSFPDFLNRSIHYSQNLRVLASQGYRPMGHHRIIVDGIPL